MLDPPNSFRRSLRPCLLTLFTLLLSCVISPAQARKRVFADDMVTNQDYQGDTDPGGEAKIAAYEREIQQAQAVGVPGNPVLERAKTDFTSGSNPSTSTAPTAVTRVSGAASADNPEVNGIEVLH